MRRTNRDPYLDVSTLEIEQTLADDDRRRWARLRPKLKATGILVDRKPIPAPSAQTGTPLEPIPDDEKIPCSRPGPRSRPGPAAATSPEDLLRRVGRLLPILEGLDRRGSDPLIARRLAAS